MSKKRAKVAKKLADSRPSGPVCATGTPADEVDASDPTVAHFFSAPPVTYNDEPAGFVEAEAPVRRAIASPERRRYLGRFVASAVALSVAICVAAAVRVATVHADTSVAPPRSHAAQATQAETPPSSPVPEAPLPVEAPVVAVASAEAPVAAAANEVSASAKEIVGAANDVPAAAPVPSSDGPTNVDAPVDADPAAAREAKRTSQRALDRGDALASIEAGERSTALDPSDAEAWLILGAAYQTHGTYPDARRCFSSCVRLAKRGPRGECAALLH